MSFLRYVRFEKYKPSAFFFTVDLGLDPTAYYFSLCLFGFALLVYKHFEYPEAEYEA